jgi:hypothetical protein
VFVADWEEISMSAPAEACVEPPAQSPPTELGGGPPTERDPRPEAELARLPLEMLEREITELAAHIHAATCRFLLLVRELDRREGWAEWGCKSCAHWLSWQYRGVLEVELGDSNPDLRRRYVECRHDDDGALLIEARLPAEEGALVLAALDAARDSLRGRRDASAAAAATRNVAAEMPAVEDVAAEAPAANEDVSAETPDDTRAASNADALRTGSASSTAAPASIPKPPAAWLATAASSASSSATGGRSRSAGSRAACRPRSCARCRAGTVGVASRDAVNAGSSTPTTSSTGLAAERRTSPTWSSSVATTTASCTRGATAFGAPRGAGWSSTARTGGG